MHASQAVMMRRAWRVRAGMLLHSCSRWWLKQGRVGLAEEEEEEEDSDEEEKEEEVKDNNDDNEEEEESVREREMAWLTGRSMRSVKMRRQ